jgi:hypothetical protein
MFLPTFFKACKNMSAPKYPAALPRANCWSWTACWRVLNHDGIENYHAGGLQAREAAQNRNWTETAVLLRLENACVLQVLELGDFL